MTDEQHAGIAASILAHDMMLQFMLGNLLRIMPEVEARALVDAVLNIPALPMPEGIAKDFDSADVLAGIAIAVPERMKKIVEGALGTVPGLSGNSA